MKRPSARTIALRDQLVAVLRNSSEPLTTAHIASLSGLPFHDVQFFGPCDMVHAYAVNNLCRLVHCNGTQQHIVAMPPFTGHVYPHLRRLEHLGVVRRLPADPHYRERFWEFCGEPTDSEFNAIVEAMGAS